jgi:small-conductance mechanosensitive channel
MEHVEIEAMKTIYQWIIPAVGLFVWTGLVLVIVPAIVRRLQKVKHEVQQNSRGLLGSILKIPLILILIGIGIVIFFDATPALPKKWIKYQDASLLILFVLAVYLFLDQLMVEVLKRYSRTTTVISASTGVIKILYRVAILGFIFLIILDQLKITISPLLASLGIMGLVVSLALQDTLANFFAGISLSIDRPVRIGDYIKLDSGEGYVTQIGWRSTRIRTL